MTSDERGTTDRLDQVSLFCRDIERSTRFYVDVLGFPHLGTYGDLAFFDMGGVRLYLHRKDDAEWRPRAQINARRRSAIRVLAPASSCLK